MAVLGVGIIGLGMGRNLLPVNSMPDFPARVRAVCDLIPERIENARANGVEFTTDSYGALLDKRDLDIIAIYTPDHLHRDQIIEALEAGKHVLVTKPMTVNNEESAAVVAAVKRTGKRVMVAQTQRYVRMHMAVRRLIDEGEFGEIYFAASDYYQDLRPVYDRTPWRYQAPQDFMYGGLSHNIDILRFLKGEIVEVAAFGKWSGHDERYPKKIADTFVLNLKFADGNIGRIAMAPGVRPPLPNVYVQLFGVKGTFVGDQVSLDSYDGKPIVKFDFGQEQWSMAEIRLLQNLAESIDADKPHAVTEIDGARISAVATAAW